MMTTNDASHVHFKIPLRMRRLSDSARVRLAAKSALADKGDITVARVEDTARESSKVFNVTMISWSSIYVPSMYHTGPYIWYMLVLFIVFRYDAKYVKKICPLLQQY